MTVPDVGMSLSSSHGDFGPLTNPGHSAGTPELTVDAIPSSHYELATVDLDVYEQSRLVTVNDNFGRGYSFRRNGTMLADPGQRGADRSLSSARSESPTLFS